MTKKVCVAGLGYIGLPTAILAAQSGVLVVGVDIDNERIRNINAMRSPIEEPEVEKRLASVISNGSFKAQVTYETADYYVIAVPTPFTVDKKADLSCVLLATNSIAAVLKKGDTVILESTVPVGTTKLIAQILSQATHLTPGLDFFVAYCPERVLPGNIFHELQINDRVIGGIDRASTRQAAYFYKLFVSGDLYLTTAEAAEMTKLVENSYRDVSIAISHQVASMAYQAGLDPYEIIELANKHPRVKLLNPTCGVGGHCLAVDPWFLIERFPQETTLLKAARLVNDAKPFEVVKRIEKKAETWQQSHLKKPTVLVLGLTYKANVDDLRESPALLITKELLNRKNLNVVVCDPHVQADRLDPAIAQVQVLLAAGIEKADIIVCLVAHNEFKNIEKSIIAHKKIMDFCGMLHVARNHACAQDQLYWPATSGAECLNDDTPAYKLHTFGAMKDREKSA